MLTYYWGSFSWKMGELPLFLRKKNKADPVL